MTNLRSFPIQQKLRLVILITCSAALIVACGALFALQFYFFRRDFVRDLRAVCEIIANNSTAALTFRDEEAAREILGALRAKPHVTGAAIVLRDGTRLAQIGDALVPSQPSSMSATGLQQYGAEWLYIHDVVLDNERLGALILHPDYRAKANELFRVYAGILVAVVAISFLVAALISWRLEPLILQPIRSLAETAEAISGRNDYSVRAEKFVQDELGSFTDSFNRMLNQIEARDQALSHEITERKRAEEALQQMQDRLMETSREAGMAEVATGVLHNVGNVLNSVNVSATLIAEKLHHSELAKLLRATGLIREQAGEAGRFLVEDPKGQLLPGYIVGLADLLEREQRDALAELELLNKNIEHIKDIVARQQNYARLSGVVEALSLKELVEDALRMNADSFERDGVTVNRHLEDIAPTIVDRHKVLQILINILGNARNAMSELPPGAKRLTIHLGLSRSGCADLRITDNGAGIARENLTRIFSHGFTTRKEGHGFGLHTAAVAAQQMGGRLSAESEGPGNGATFILELPLADTAAASVRNPAAAA